ncbi:uncharacterized protein NPIL_234771 [Nephila pilipes]|uniref:Uncharacterized protein n=1 Tax=Nephila pilipes TaxID=299642 RepID=A0A8X6UKJ9_NEPPI|nr:uncharacterized protein NPIL_234771 [Nephila pilipes]
MVEGYKYSFKITVRPYFLDKEKNDTITDQTKEPVDNWIPTVPPTGIGSRHPYLYFSTIVFAAVIVGTALLVVLRSCYRLSIVRSYEHYQSPADVPVITRFRRTLRPTDAIWINSRLLPHDMPPSYASVAHTSGTHQTETYINKLIKSSETPPPSYNSVL